MVTEMMEEKTRLLTAGFRQERSVLANKDVNQAAEVDMHPGLFHIMSLLGVSPSRNAANGHRLPRPTW